MFKDQTLLPVEALRLAGLGLLAERPRKYGELATEIRRFVELAVGPSLDLLAPPIELLRHEGLAAAQGDLFTLTPAGDAALRSLLQAPLRPPSNDASRLVLMLKLRFLHHLGIGEREVQRRQIAESLATERGRLEELRRVHAKTAPLLHDWLDRDIADLNRRIESFREAAPGPIIGPNEVERHGRHGTG
jgi:DNA-binding PadR family transcriptional regulator